MSEEKKNLPALVVQQNTGLVINDLDEVQRVGNLFIKSGMFPETSVEKDLAKVCVKIIAGQELGLKPFQAMRGIDIIQGTPAFRYQVVGAKIKQSGRYDYSVVEASVSVAKIQFYEFRKPVFLSVYTMADAATEGLASKDNYKKRPADMLFARALTKGANKICPELFFGSVLTPEDLGFTSGEAFVTEADPEPEIIEAQAEEAQEVEIVEAVATKPPKQNKPAVAKGKPAATPTDAVANTNTTTQSAAERGASQVSDPKSAGSSAKPAENTSTATNSGKASDSAGAAGADPKSTAPDSSAPPAAKSTATSADESQNGATTAGGSNDPKHHGPAAGAAEARQSAVTAESGDSHTDAHEPSDFGEPDDPGDQSPPPVATQKPRISLMRKQ